jgi:hypothetical protein
MKQQPNLERSVQPKYNASPSKQTYILCNEVTHEGGSEWVTPSEAVLALTISSLCHEVCVTVYARMCVFLSVCACV